MELTREQIKEKYKYSIVGSFNDCDTTWARLNGKSFHINRQGERLYTAEFNAVGSFNDCDTTWAVLKRKCFHINRQGEKIYTAEFDDVGSFNGCDITWVRLNGSYFHINRQGEILESTIIEKIGSRYDDLYITKYNGNVYFSTGCFFGTLEEFKAAVIDKHSKDSNHYKDYMEVIEKWS